MTTELQEPPEGWYRENKKTYTVEISTKHGSNLVLNYDRMIYTNIQQIMKNLLNNNVCRTSVKLVNEPIGHTEHEYRREATGEIVYYGWSNCD